MTIENIKELKRDIVNGFKYISIQEENTVNDVYTVEYLIYEKGKIIYSCDNIDTYAIFTLCDNVDDFLKKPCIKILAEINEGCYYNTFETVETDF